MKYAVNPRTKDAITSMQAAAANKQHIYMQYLVRGCTLLMSSNYTYILLDFFKIHQN